jgi:starch phosphorylase
MVIPCFYDRDENGIPRVWVARMRKSMAELTPRFSSNRMLREYVNRFYLPAGRGYRNRSGDQAKKAVRVCEWRESLEKNWRRLFFGKLEVHEKDDAYHFTLPVYLTDLDPGAVIVQIYADACDEEGVQIHPMDRGHRLPGTETAYAYTLSIPIRRSISDYTPRIIPFLEEAAVPLEAHHILWYR